MQFFWLAAFGPITGDPEFLPDKKNKNISFHFRLLPRKTNDKIFQAIQKTLFRGHVAMLAFLAQIWAKIIFLEKKGLAGFKYFNYLPSRQKSEKTNMLLLRKMLNWWMDGRADGRTDRQPWFCRIFRRTGVQLLK